VVSAFGRRTPRRSVTCKMAAVNSPPPPFDQEDAAKPAPAPVSAPVPDPTNASAPVPASSTAASSVLTVVLLFVIFGFLAMLLYVWDVASQARRDAGRAASDAAVARRDLEAVREELASMSIQL
jgi:hypothetical protein